MKKLLLILISLVLAGLGWGCSSHKQAQVAATTLPVYGFTAALCEGTGISVTRLVTEEVSCLHDYSLQTRQMRAIEGAQVVVVSGGGLEEFLEDALTSAHIVIDASESIELHCGDGHDHDHGNIEHGHKNDPHIWLSPENARIMVHNICHGLTAHYPQYAEIFQENEEALVERLNALRAYGEEQLSSLSCRELITFHDGFAYLAEAFDLTILRAIEEESGSEASAAELIEIIQMVNAHQLPAIFTERSGSSSAAHIISAETGAKAYALDMAMSGDSYFDAMYHNIDTLKEALG